MNQLSHRPLLFWLLLSVAAFVFLYAIKAILLPFMLGILVAYLLDPAADSLERIGASRTASTSLITLTFFGILILGLVWLIPTLVKQGDALIQAMPSYVEKLRHWAEHTIAHYSGLLNEEDIATAREAVNGSSGKVAGVLGPLFKSLLSSGATLISLGSLFILSPIVTFYLLRDWDRIIASLDGLLPRPHAETIREQVLLIDQTLSGFVRGILNVMLILGVFYAVGLSMVGLNFAILIGLLGGVAIIIPYIGTVVSGAAAVGMAYMQFDSLTPVIITLCIFTAGQLLEGYILTPKLVGDKIGLHPLWLIFGMLAGGALFGFVGILLAIPVTAIIGVLIRFAIGRYRESELYEPKANA
jgi:predicted PurR-regulated permease PerM